MYNHLHVVSARLDGDVDVSCPPQHRDEVVQTNPGRCNGVVTAICDAAFFLALFMLLPAAHFYGPGELSAQFYWVLAAYTAVSAVDLVLYFKAISLGNISVISSVLSLGVVSNLIGVYVFLGQAPSQTGLLACVLILLAPFWPAVVW